MNLSKLTAAVALSVASIGAHAAIAPTSPGSELFFFAYGDTAKQTFVYDTGLSVATFTPGSAPATSNQSFNLNAQGFSFNAFLAANPDAVWGLLAADTQGSAAAVGTRRTIATVTDATNASLIASPWTGAAGSIGTFITATNALGATESTHGSQENGASVHTTVDASDTASWQQSINATLVNTLQNSLIAGSIGQSLSFMTWTNAAGGAPVGVQYLQTDGATAAFWNVLSSGTDSTLSFTAVAPIPEPSDLAFMVAGLSLAGAIARRRKKLA